jgi:L-alanine-DL-glutamate epimerase-like enolase superfamily enzyme
MLTKYLTPLIIGENPFNIEHIHRQMDNTLHGVPAAKAAIDIACYDLMGKASSQPLYNLLGGRYQSVLEIPYVVGIQEPDKMAVEAKNSVERGYTNLKIKVGTSNPKQDVERIRAVREAVGESVHLRVDANQGWKNKACALSILKQVDDCQIDWIEQPVIAKDIVALAEIRRQISIPVMVDEGLHGDKEMREIITMQAADLINIKLMKCGGIYPALRLVSQAEMAGVECMIGSMIESSIATAAGAHLATAKKQIIANEMAGPLVFSRDLAPLDYRGSQLHLNTQPGLGIDVDETVMKELLVMEEIISE